MQAMDRCTAAVLISQPSCRVPEPIGVLITRLTNPWLMTSTAESLFVSAEDPDDASDSECLRTTTDGIPLSAKNECVPDVA